MSSSQDPHTQTQMDALELADIPDIGAQVVPHASLLVVSGPSAGKVHHLTAREVLIGRAPSAHVRIDERGVSARHARVAHVDGRHVLVDLGSTNGTFLNGRRLDSQQPVALNPGDSVQVAETVLAYIEGSGDRTAEHTQQLSRLAPVMPESALLKLPEAQLLAQLLQAPTGPPPKPQLTFDEQLARVMRALRLIRRHWAVLLAAAAVGALVADATVFINPPVSEATFKLRVSPPSKDPLKESGYTPASDLDLFYASTEQNFLSPGLVTETLKVVDRKTPTRAAVAGTLKGMKFDAVGEALYKGTFNHKDPEYAVTFLKRHLEGFIRSEIQRSVHVARAEVDFLAARLKETEVELARTEKELQEFKSKHLEGLPENSSGHLASRETLMTRRAELGAQLEKTRLELDLAKRQLAEEAPVAAKQAEGSEPFERALVDVRRQLGEARAKGLGEAHPQVIALKKQVTDLERLAAEARTKSTTDFDRKANPGLVALRNRVGELEVAYRGTQAELGSIGSLVSRLDSIVGRMPEVEARYSELTRSYTATKEMHAKLFDKLRTNQLQLELENASAKARYEIMSPPETSGLPLRRTLMLRSLLGLTAGLLVGACIVAILELRRYLLHRRGASVAIVPVRPNG